MRYFLEAFDSSPIAGFIYAFISKNWFPRFHAPIVSLIQVRG
jgi:hypothetical protein